MEGYIKRMSQIKAPCAFPHDSTSGKGFLYLIQRLVEFSFYKLREFQEVCESSEFTTKNGCRIEFPREYKEYGTHPCSLKLGM